VDLNGTVTLTANVTPSNAANKAVTWSSSAPGTVEVVAAGANPVTLRGLAVGNATITVTTADQSKTDTCTVVVSPPPNDSVYIATDFGLVKDGALLTGYGNGSAHLLDVCVVGANVHACGWRGNDAVYYLNGTETVLARTAGTTYAEAYRMYISGSNVYTTGYEYTESTGAATAMYWRNGARQTINFPTNTTFSMAKGIALLGADVYIAGYLEAGGGYPCILNVAQTDGNYMRWGSGTLTAGYCALDLLSDGTYLYPLLPYRFSRVTVSPLNEVVFYNGDCFLYRIYRGGTTTYGAGYLDDDDEFPPAWVSSQGEGTGVDHTLPWSEAGGIVWSEARGIFATSTGPRIYVCGYDALDVEGDDGLPVLWRNGNRLTVPAFAGKHGAANCVWVVEN